MRIRRLPVLLSGLLLLPGLGRLFGGWAVITVEHLPDHVVAGQPVTLTFTIRQHGVSPMEKLTPRLEARSGTSEVQATATASRQKGQYLATFQLPTQGDWVITIRSGFGNSDLTLLPLRAIGPRETPAVPSEAERGRNLFAAKGCVGCHVRNELRSEGMQPIGPDLTGKSFAAEFLTKYLADPASLGPPRYGNMVMPNLQLKQQEIAALTAYLSGGQSGDR